MKPSTCSGYTRAFSLAADAEQCRIEMEQARAALLAGEEPVDGLLLWIRDNAAEMRLIEAERG